MDSSLLHSYAAQGAYLLTLFSFAFRDLKWLRFFALGASACTIYYAFTTQMEPMWTPIFWHTLFGTVNGLQLFLYFWAKRVSKLDPLETFLSQTVLANFPSHEVKSFTKFAKEAELEKDAWLIKAGTELSHLFCILQGKVEIYSRNIKVAELNAGRFVGEMSFLTQAKTRADVKAAENLKLLVWPTQEIEEWVGEDPTRLALLQTALGTQIVEELLRQQDEKLEGIA